MLSIKHNPKLFYRIDLKSISNLDQETKEVIQHINSSWSDIEYSNYLFHKNFGQLSDANEKEIGMFFTSLLIFSNSFYTHLSTVYLLMKKLNSKYPKSTKRLLIMNKKFFERIQTIRNCILIHKEKDSFYKNPKNSMSSTDPKHLIEQKMYVIENGSKKIYTLKPLKDVDMMFRLVQNFEHLLQSENSKLEKSA